MKTRVILFLERLLGRQIVRRSPGRGADLFANIDQVYGKNNIRVVFDVGANVGQSASAYRKEFPNAEIYSFEPVADTFQQLAANISGTNGVHVFQIGFGNQVSSMTINLAEDSRCSSIKYPTGIGSETVNIQTLDSFSEGHGFKTIDFLKIDTEGYELEILEGAHELLKNQKIGMIYIETELMRSTRHFVPIHMLNTVLEGHGYEIFGVYEQQPHWSGEHSILFCNVLYIAPKLIPQHVNPAEYPLRADETR